MTICIATICDDSKKVVVASDRMIIGSYPPIKFEHTSSKIKKLTNKCIMLSAGEALPSEELYQKVKQIIKERGEENLLISEISNIVKKEYEEMRKRRIEDLALKPRGIENLKDFYENYSKRIPEGLIANIDSFFVNYKYNFIVLITGLDKEGTHIFNVTNPGLLFSHDLLGHCCIGIGELYASTALILSNHNPRTELAHGIFNTYKAKRSSEIAPGIGKAIDMAIIDEEGIKLLKEEDIKELENIYRKMSRTRSLNDLLKGLKLSFYGESK